MSDIQKASDLVHEMSKGLKTIPEPKKVLYIVAPMSYNCEYGSDEYWEAVSVFDTREAAEAEVKRLDSTTKYYGEYYKITELVLNKAVV